MAASGSKKKSNPKGRRRAMAPRRRRYGARKTNVPDVASVSVAYELPPVNTNKPYAYESFRLSDIPRAVQVAQAYQQYRIANIRITWKPLYDTFSAATAVTKPSVYYYIDRAGSVPDAFTVAMLKQMGIRPHALDEKPLSVSWKPSTLQQVGGGADANQVVRYSPWLSTNGNATVAAAPWIPSDVNHLGIKYFIESADGLQTTPVQLTIEYQIQFKKPNWVTSSSDPAPTVAEGLPKVF